MKVVFTEEAERDLQESVSYLFERDPRAATELIDEVFDLAPRAPKYSVKAGACDTGRAREDASR